MTWRDDALCAQVGGEPWFPDKGANAAPAKTICAGCPVRATCLQYALTHREEHGVWGGLTPRERRALAHT